MANVDERPPIKLKRNSVACKRCRRLRSKCTHESAIPPCASCKEAGGDIAAECFFPRRGEDSTDREYRIKRPRLGEREESQTSEAGRNATRENASSTSSSSVRTPRVSAEPNSNLNLLPPINEVVESCQLFMNLFFQLGFIPKAVFIERLSSAPETIPEFLLLCILSISARFTPSLISRYGHGDGIRASQVFMHRANELVPAEMYKPSLERVQAFFILSVAEWGHADGDRSFMHMGIAVRMAGMLRLHREETYRLPHNSSTDDVIKAEVARRSFWMVADQANLQAGINAPAAFCLTDITALLPSEEHDFAFGVNPSKRAALVGTRAEIISPELASLPERSLFATLIQTHSLWRQVASQACQWEIDLPSNPNGTSTSLRGQSGDGNSIPVWSVESEYTRLASALEKFEMELPPKHRWSLQNLRGYRAESLDLAYLSSVMVLRLSNIVIRRVYLPCIAAAFNLVDHSGRPAVFQQEENHVDINLSSQTSELQLNSAPASYWQDMSNDIFQNVRELYEQFDAYFPLRPQGFPPILVFCVYICGSLASYLCKWPQLCPSIATQAQIILYRALDILTELQHVWPKARSWQNSLAMSASLFPRPDVSSFASSAASYSHTFSPSLVASAQPQSQPIAASTDPGSGGHSGMLYKLAFVASQRQPDHPHPQGPLDNHVMTTGRGFHTTHNFSEISNGHDTLVQPQAPVMETFFANSFETELNSFLHDDILYSGSGPGRGISEAAPSHVDYSYI